MIQEFQALSQDLPEQSPSSGLDAEVVPVARRRQLEHAGHIIAAQKKLCELLGLPTEQDRSR